MSETTVALDGVTVELADVRTALDTVAARQGWIVIALGVVALLLAAAVTVGTVAVARFQASDQAIRSAVQDNNQILCPAIRQLASTEPPRTTPAGDAQAEEFARLMRSPEYNC